MDRQEAIEFLMDHYENPRNNAPLEHADISLCGGNPGCADIITMHARLDKDGKLEAVNWEGEGCTISRAAASYVSEITQGMTAEEVEEMSFEDLVEQLKESSRRNGFRGRKRSWSGGRLWWAVGRRFFSF